ncbi:MAG: glucosaminidase domain-containing protein [Bacteroidales bacterium]
MCTRKILLFSGMLLLSMTLFSQYRNTDYHLYVKKYGQLAVDHQKKYKIPASITLAQGILESGAGKGRLAREANNHFGIKCSNWNGKKIYHDDDNKNDCFRKYSHVEESYHDHSLFLTQRERYSMLFRLNATDYRGWARGLQKCGYATDKGYANKLIKIIEDYELYKYDQKSFIRPEKSKGLPDWYKPHQVYITNDLLYIVARENDTYDLIAKELDFSEKKLRSYNELPADFPLEKGDIIFLKKKKKAGPKNKRYHTIEPGESMHSISQLYGIRLKSLYKINNKDEEYTPVEGEILRLR